ncbi:VOC family protein [Allorhizocola rhizosphaerae]|uniref:VOC family protein n=1 Tax=Allorhizocola rhizosphaerae TaxID=1872709 RepID=UPI000E3D0D9B|nr:VOC family protein [Allorhizocola rhizosphaerae]
MANPSGMPSWIDLQTTDVEAARHFYSRLFGWTTQVSPEPEAMGYTLFLQDGKQVAGVGPAMAPGTPPVWTMYVATDDADATTVKVEQAGGTVLVPPMDVLDYGRMAVFVDPSGAAFAVWQAGKNPGGELFGVDNTYCWSELTTREPKVGKDFYPKVFGWTFTEREGPNPYTTFQLGDGPAAGMMVMEGEQWPPDLPNHWMNYIQVAGCDATAARVKELGGTVTVEPSDTPFGRFAIVHDPQGAYFSVIQMNPDFQPS